MKKIAIIFILLMLVPSEALAEDDPAEPEPTIVKTFIGVYERPETYCCEGGENVTKYHFGVIHYPANDGITGTYFLSHKGLKNTEILVRGSIYIIYKYSDDSHEFAYLGSKAPPKPQQTPSNDPVPAILWSSWEPEREFVKIKIGERTKNIMTSKIKNWDTLKLNNWSKGQKITYLFKNDLYKIAERS